MNLDIVNAWTDAEACEAFLKCCGAKSWANQMAERRPFSSDEDVLDAACRIWRALSRADWLEAFAAHPKIGDLNALKKKFAGTASWAASEQAGVAGAADAVFAALAKGNRQYEARFGHIFIVCATGKSADEMLALLQQRLNNDPVDEIQIAASEQEKIMLLRLKKMTP